MSPGGKSGNMFWTSHSFAFTGVIFQPDGQFETISMKQVPFFSFWYWKDFVSAFLS
jgi:hypothetical protein